MTYQFDIRKAFRTPQSRLREYVEMKQAWGIDNLAGGVRTDSLSTAFAERSLIHEMSKVVETLFQENTARRDFPINTEPHPGMKFTEYEQAGEFGEADIDAQGANDWPDADVRFDSVPRRIKELRVKTVMTYKEEWSQAATGRNLETRKAMAAGRALRSLECQLAYQGDANDDIIGLANHPGINVNAATNGDWANVATTGEQVLQDMLDCVNSVVNGSGGVHDPTTVVLPVAQYQTVSQKTFNGTGDNSTVLEQFTRRTGITDIRKSQWLTDIGPGGEAAMLAYTPQADHLEMVIPQDVVQLPIKVDIGRTIRPYVLSNGGLFIYYPKSVSLCYGI